MLWEALAKRRLTDGDKEAAVVHKRTKGTQPRVASVNPEVPAALAAICDKALAFKPEDRFATAAEMKAALEGYLDAEGLRATDTEIGALVSEAFVAERERIRELLEKQIVSLSRAGSGLTSLPSLRAAEGTPSLYPLGPAPTTPSQAPPFSVTNAGQPVSRVPVLAVVAGVAAVVGLVVVGGIFLGLRSAGPAQAGSAASVATASAPTAALGAPSSAASPRPDDTTDVRIGSLPTAKPSHAGTPSFSAAPSASVAPSASASAAKPDVGPGAGVDLPRDPRPKHTIDEKDPYP